MAETLSGQDINICGDLPTRASEIQRSLAVLKFSSALEKLFVLQCFIKNQVEHGAGLWKHIL